MLHGRSYGEILRDTGLSLVSKAGRSAWHRAAVAEVFQLPPGWVGIGEDIKPYIIPKIGEPHKPNAWGAVWMHAARLKYIEYTGIHLQMKKPGSHARESKQWRRL